MSDYESSSGSSSRENLAVKYKFGSACILCGYPRVVDVVEILADGAPVKKLRKWSTQLSVFQTDDFENFICFCPNHHQEYKAGLFAIVPSPNVRKQMKEHELRDFELRQQAVSMGSYDPGRTLLMPPQLPYEFEYVPITVPFYYGIHNETPVYPETFLFNGQNIFPSDTLRVGDTFHVGTGQYARSIQVREYPLRSWNISVYAALMAAFEPLRSPDRLLGVGSDAAFNDVTELVNLYKRQGVVQVEASPGGAEVEEGLGDGSDDLESKTTDMERPDPLDYDDDPVITPAALGDGSDDLESETMDTERPDPLDDDDDPVITPAALSGRIRWTPAMSAYSSEGFMRFATSSDFVRDPSDEPQEK